MTATPLAVVAAIAVFTLLSLPPASLDLDTSWEDGTVPGLLHIHTSRSDGRSTPDEVAAAAARAGLTFIVFTDHGDATRTPDPPVYRSGVLCLDGVEISTANGHYLALDMAAAPYPLGGEGRDVVDDVKRLGGFGIVAHPASPKPELAWSDWNAPIDGLEIINPDTSWRVHMFDRGWGGRRTLLHALLTYPMRASETIGGLLTDASAAQAQWTALTATRPLVGVAGVDAHARLELRAGEHGADSYALPIPGYESSFRTLSVHVAPTEPLTGDAAADARRVIGAVRKGRIYTVVDAWASPPRFDVTARNAKATAKAGDELETAGPMTLHVRSNTPPSFRTSIWRDNEALATDTAERDITLTTDGRRGAYRVEIRSTERPAGPPWLIANPIYVRDTIQRQPNPVAASKPASQLSLFDGRSTAGWTTESDETSLASIEAVQMLGGIELRLRYGLSGGGGNQYAGAAVETTHGVASYDRATVTIRAERPTRLSVQMRAEYKDSPPERWQRSIYVDTSDRVHTIAFGDMRPIAPTRSPRAPLADVHALLFIVDTTNTTPGSSGRIWMKNVRLEQSQ